MHKRKLLRRGGGSLLTGLLLALVLNFTMSGLKTSADTTSPWLGVTDPVLQKDSEFAPGTAVPYSVNGNRDCTQTTMAFVTNKQDVCGVETSFGLLDSNSNLQLNNTKSAGKLNNYNGYQQGIIGVPSSSTVINYTSPPTAGLYLWFTKNLQDAINTTVNPVTYQVNYQVNRGADVGLRDKAHTLLAAQTDSLSFSSNGKWMVVDSPYRAMLRVNLDTFEVLPFAPAFNYDIGIAPGAQTAVSSDGRYAVVASRPFNLFKIYDLSTCGVVPNSVSTPVTCQSRDLLPFMQSKITNLQGVSAIRFLSDDSLSLYANYYLTAGVSSTNQVAKYILSSAGGSAQRIEYLAMGDSYISGEGAYDYQDGTDTDNNHCHLSQKSYPHLVAVSLSFNSFHSVACSGATMNDINNGSGQYKGQVRDNKTRDQRNSESILSSFSVGYINQSDFVTRYRPGAVTLSISGNDIGFSSIVKTCVTASYTCYNTYEDRLELIRQINAKFPKIVETYKKIKNVSPDSKVYVVGYPQIAFVGGNCANNVHLNTEEIGFSQQIISYLDLVIKQAASKAGVYYVDTENALAGHRLCETKSSDVAVNGLTAGNDKPSFLHGPMGNESYHPNQLGHQILEQAVLAATQSLTQTMPTANPNAAPPSETGLAILDMPHTNRGIYNLNYNNQMTGDVAYKGTLQSIYVDGLEYSLKLQSSYSATIHSDPINLGSFSTDANGDLSFSAQIPSGVPTGYHTLQVTGTNFAGELVNIYKIIYVAASQDDYDGDGIVNSIDPCGFVGVFHQDYDQDSLDDSCDGFIDEPPAVITPPPTTEPTSPADETPADPEPTTTQNEQEQSTPPADSSTPDSESVPDFQPATVPVDIPQVINTDVQPADNLVPNTSSQTVQAEPSSVIATAATITNQETATLEPEVLSDSISKNMVAARVSTVEAAASSPTASRDYPKLMILASGSLLSIISAAAWKFRN